MPLDQVFSKCPLNLGLWVTGTHGPLVDDLNNATRLGQPEEDGALDQLFRTDSKLLPGMFSKAPERLSKALRARS